MHEHMYRTWLANNMLKLNDEKIVLASNHVLRSLNSTAVMVGDQQIEQLSSVRDLGVVYDQHLSMTQHVNSVESVDTSFTVRRKHLFMRS